MILLLLMSTITRLFLLLIELKRVCYKCISRISGFSERMYSHTASHNYRPIVALNVAVSACDLSLDRKSVV